MRKRTLIIDVFGASDIVELGFRDKFSLGRCFGVDIIAIVFRVGLRLVVLGGGINVGIRSDNYARGINVMATADIRFRTGDGGNASFARKMITRRTFVTARIRPDA